MGCTAPVIGVIEYSMWCLFKGSVYFRAVIIFKEKNKVIFNNTIYLVNEPVQNKKKTQYSHFKLQHHVKSGSIF